MGVESDLPVRQLPLPATSRRLCLLVARNLGDAVIHAEFLKNLVDVGYGERYLVWTFRQAAFLFEGIPGCETVYSDFPMGATIPSFKTIKGLRSFLAAVRRVRRWAPSETLELVADWRERLTCRLLGAKINHSPGWAADHAFRKHSRVGKQHHSALVTIPVQVPNLYDAYARVFAALNSGVAPGLWTTAAAAVQRGARWCVGMHPFASGDFKLWPLECWAGLIQLLRVRIPDLDIVLFGAPSDRKQLETLAAQLDSPAELFCGSLQAFRQRLQSGVDVLVGLDSFSVHLAHSLRVPVVVLVGANDPAVFTPPGSTAVTHPGRCPYQPCSGKPQCRGTDFQFACMRSITPVQVVDATLLHRPRLPDDQQEAERSATAALGR